MTFCWSTLTVKSMEESLKFYGDIIGLKVKRIMNHGSDVQIAFLGNGGTDIELVCDASNKDIAVGKDISWGFEVDSLDETLEMIQKKGLKVHSGPFEPTPNIRFFFILDPNGLKIQIIEKNEK